MKKKVYPDKFVPVSEEFASRQELKKEVYEFLKEEMEAATEKAFGGLGIECATGAAGRYGDGTVYGVGTDEGGKCNVKVGSKTLSHLEKQVSYGGKRMFVETSFEIDAKNKMIHMIYRTTEKAVFNGHSEKKGGFFVHEDYHMSLEDMAKFKKEMKKNLKENAEKEAKYLVNTKIGVDDRVETNVTQSVVESIFNKDGDDFLDQMDKLFENISIEEKKKEDAIIQKRMEEGEETLCEDCGCKECECEKEDIEEVTSTGSAGAFSYDAPLGAPRKRSIKTSAPFDQPVNEGEEYSERFKQTAYYQKMIKGELKSQGNNRLMETKDENGDSFWTVVSDEELKNYRKPHVMGAPGAAGVELGSQEEEDYLSGGIKKFSGGKSMKKDKKENLKESVDNSRINNSILKDEKYQEEYMKIDESVRKRYLPNREMNESEQSARWAKLVNFGERESIRMAENAAKTENEAEILNEWGRSKPEPKEDKELYRNQNIDAGSYIDGKKLVKVVNEKTLGKVEYLTFEEDALNEEKAFFFDFISGIQVKNPNYKG